jgi:hypothetical protein
VPPFRQDQGVVLVGEQGLLPPSLRAKDEKAVGHGRVSQGRLGLPHQAAEEGIVQGGHHPPDLQPPQAPGEEGLHQVGHFEAVPLQVQPLYPP